MLALSSELAASSKCESRRQTEQQNVFRSTLQRFSTIQLNQICLPELQHLAGCGGFAKIDHNDRIISYNLVRLLTEVKSFLQLDDDLGAPV